MEILGLMELWVSLLELNNYLTSSWKKRFFTKGILNGYYNYVSGSISKGNVSFNVRETTTSSAVIGLNITADNFKANRVVQGTVENSLNVEYLWINTGTTFNNLEFNLQLKKESNSANFVEHQEQAITMPVQQEMLQGDYIDWENEKEIHKWLKVILDGTQNLIQQNTSTDGKYRYAFNILTNLNKQVENCSLLENKAYCDCLKMLGKGETISCIEGFTVINNVLWIYTDGSRLEEFKTKLSNKPITFYIPLVESDKLPFTEEQKAVAKQIKETAHSYKGTTHIFSTDEISPIFDVVYAKDLNTTISNIQALVLNNASEEVNG